MRLVKLSPAPREPTPAELAERERTWLQALRDGRYECRWHRVGDVEWSSAVLVDGVRICLSYRSSLEAARILSGRLPTTVEALAMFAAARHIEPVVLRPVSASTEAIRRHSHEVGVLDDLADNEGKLWIAGAPRGRAWNFGWPSSTAPHVLTSGLRGWQPLAAAHTDGHVDYSQTLRVVRDVRPCPVETPPRSAPPSTPTAPTPTELGERGARVAAWQRYLAAAGYAPGTADGIHGPRTEAATVAWRADHDLVDTVRDVEPSPAGHSAEPRIVTTAEWGARPVPVQPTREAVGIVIHHMALGARPGRRGTLWEYEDVPHEIMLGAGKALARNLQASHQARGWVDTGQHWSVTRGGVTLEGRTGSLGAARRGLVVRGAHAGDAANADHWGIEVEGDYTDGRYYGDATPQVPEPQWRALVELVAWLCRVGALSVDAIRGHREVPGNATGCPGTLLDRLPDLRAVVRARSA